LNRSASPKAHPRDPRVRVNPGLTLQLLFSASLFPGDVHESPLEQEQTYVCIYTHTHTHIYIYIYIYIPISVYMYIDITLQLLLSASLFPGDVHESPLEQEQILLEFVLHRIH